ncbi:MAG: hypothetical protein CMJ18_05270 [Phycisphaeraceae bacterium]|nr:hypothetical protein [Phycisphaeraceae bacterium]
MNVFLRGCGKSGRAIRVGVLVMVAVALSQVACAQQTVVLAREGKAACSIVLPADALEHERTAAQELADHLEQIVGDRPQTGDQPGPGTNIYVGRSPEIERLVGDVDFDALETDGIVMRTVGDDLVLTGGRPRGVLFSVYSFLQDVVGVRWWTPELMHIPSKPSLTVSDLDVVYRPPFDVRLFYTGGYHGDGDFARRLRHNGFLLGIDIGDHTSLKLLPPDEHYLEHPDWYVYRPEGDDNKGEYGFDFGFARVSREKPSEWVDLVARTRRLPYEICVSSTGGLEAATAAVRRQLEEKYAKWNYPPKVVLVTQNNGGWQCKCEPCEAMTAREGAPSSGWITFVNAIARRLEHDYPDVLIATMAFLQNEKPPARLRAHPNVFVILSPVTSDRKRPLSEVPQGQWVARWKEVARHVLVWEHAVNFWRPIPPHPNHFVMGHNLRFFAEHGVMGLLIEGGGNGVELQEMRTYVTNQLLWDPRQDQRRLMTGFLDAYYGDAAPSIMKWIDVQHEAAQRAEDFVLGAYTVSTEGWLTFDDLSKGTRLFDEALRAVEGDAELSQRVRKAKLSVDFVWLDRYPELRATADERGVPFPGPADPHAALERFAKNEFRLNWNRLPRYVKQMRETLKGE